MIKRDESSRKNQTKSSIRRVYHSPQLEVYGDIRVLTLGMGGGATKDNKGKDPTKTG